MTPFLRSTLSTLLVLLVASSGTAVTLAAGLDDNFAAPADTVFPSAALTAVLAGFGGVQNFDLIAGVNGANDRQVAHTFTGLAGLAGGTLEIRVRAGQIDGVQNDGLFLSFVETAGDSYADKIVWVRSFGAVTQTLPWYPEDDPGLVAPTWMPGDEAFITLNLASMPLPDGSTVNLVPQIAAKGFLDINVSDDTAADYAVLEVQLSVTDAPIVVSAPSDLRVFPNPFREATALSFSVTQAGPTSLAIYDVTGRPVRKDWRVDWAPGKHTVTWDGRDDSGRRVATGVYWARLSTGGVVETARVVHLR